MPFVAGDQPVIHLKGQAGPDLCFYWPLSPTLAMIYHADPVRFREDRMVMSRFEAEHYNVKLYSRSDSQMYSNDRAYLEAMITLPIDAGAFGPD